MDKMGSKHKYSTIVLIILILIVFVVLFVQAIEIGQESECASGEMIMTTGGVWVCKNTTDMNLTVTVEVILNDPCSLPNVYCHQINTDYGTVYLNFSSIHNGTFTYEVIT